MQFYVRTKFHPSLSLPSPHIQSQTRKLHTQKITNPEYHKPKKSTWSQKITTTDYSKISQPYKIRINETNFFFLVLFSFTLLSRNKHQKIPFFNHNNWIEKSKSQKKKNLMESQPPIYMNHNNIIAKTHSSWTQKKNSSTHSSNPLKNH